MGVAAPTGDVDESDWLDRVADDVAPASDDPIWLEEVSEERDASTETQEGETPASEDDSAEESSEEILVGVSDDSPAKDASDERVSTEVRGVSAPASTTLTDGVYDEIRRLRSKVVEK
jgi:E3 ubiquitin-protein ligase DOA10